MLRASPALRCRACVPCAERAGTRHAHAPTTLRTPATLHGPHVAAPICDATQLSMSVQNLKGKGKAKCIELVTKLSQWKAGKGPEPDNDIKKAPPGGDVCNCMHAFPEEAASKLKCRLDSRDNGATFATYWQQCRDNTAECQQAALQKMTKALTGKNGFAECTSLAAMAQKWQDDDLQPDMAKHVCAGGGAAPRRPRGR